MVKGRWWRGARLRGNVRTTVDTKHIFGKISLRAAKKKRNETERKRSKSTTAKLTRGKTISHAVFVAAN
jgi:hypothetical protein